MQGGSDVLFLGTAMYSEQNNVDIFDLIYADGAQNILKDYVPIVEQNKMND